MPVAAAVAVAAAPALDIIYKMSRVPGRGQTVVVYHEGLKATELAPNKVYTEWSTAKKFKMKTYVLTGGQGDYSDVYEVEEELVDRTTSFLLSCNEKKLRGLAAYINRLVDE